MAWVIGYEGRREPSAPLSWGAAALRHDGNVVSNAISGLGRPRTEEELGLLADQGAITLLPEDSRVQFRGLADDARPVVLEVLSSVSGTLRLGEIARSYAHVRPGADAGEHEEYLYFIFRERDHFDLVRAEVADGLIHHVLYTLSDDIARIDAISLGLALTAHHHILNALWAWFSPGDRTVLKRRAEARVRSDDGKRAFHKFYAVLEKLGEDYVISYEDGVTDGGGMDTDKAVPVLSGFGTMHARLRDVAVEPYRFLNAGPANRLHAMSGAASAIFTFRPKVEGRPLGEQIARYLELELMKKVLAGESVLPSDSTLEKAVRKITEPSADTAVKHKMLEVPTGESALATKQRLDPIVRSTQGSATAVAKWPNYSDPMTLLGYQSGSVREWTTIEISIAPGRRLKLSPTKDQSGNRPLGIDNIFGARKAYARPALFKVVRDNRYPNTPTFYLSEVIVLGSSPMAITGMTSGVVSGGFLMPTGVTIHVKGSECIIEGRGVRVAIPSDSIDVVSAQKWMRAYAEACFRLELQDLRIRRLAPVFMPSPGEAVCLLWALEKLGGMAKLSDARRMVIDRFGASASLAYPRRFASGDDALIMIDGDSAQPTEYGARYLAAFRAIDRRAVGLHALPGD